MKNINIIGIKHEMSNIVFNGVLTPCTTIFVGDTFYVQQTYDILQKQYLVTLGCGKKKYKNMLHVHKKHMLTQDRGFQYLVNIWLNDLDGINMGDQVIFDSNIKNIDIVSKSIGKGFCGVMKRYNFSGGPASHGASLFHRRPGSIGSEKPGFVLKGQKMPGKHGKKNSSVFNLQILSLTNDKIIVRGSIPGPLKTLVSIRYCKNK